MSQTATRAVLAPDVPRPGLPPATTPAVLTDLVATENHGAVPPQGSGWEPSRPRSCSPTAAPPER